MFTDALDMKGVSGSVSPAACALFAGIDVLFALANVKKEIDAIENAVKINRIPKSLINEKCRKILQYKYILGVNNVKQIDAARIASNVNTNDSRALSEKLISSSITVVRNVDNLLPLKSLDRESVL